jgi:hypothetical protein
VHNISTNNKYSSFVILFAAAFLMEGETTFAESGVRTWDLRFRGTASGGELVLMRTFNRTVEYVPIPTSPKEPAWSVVSRLADAINAYVLQDTTKVSSDQHKLWLGDGLAKTQGDTLTLPSSYHGYALAGTEVGLGIPRPPLSLSCSLEGDKVVLRWINPPSTYDFILVQTTSMKDGHISYKHLPGSAESLTIELAKIPINSDDIDFRVIGFRDKIPSNAAAIHVSGHSQQEIYGIPFTNGIAPNWTAWSTSAETNATPFEQVEKYPAERPYIPPLGLLTKPFYQVIKAPPKGVVHGVYRKFLGLTPGHTYRLTACLTTQDMDSIKADWSLSLHAAPTPTGKDLSVEQLTGLAPLPDGRRGPEGGRIAFYGPGSTTKRDFALVFSGKDAPGGFDSCHITLPAGIDTITVWVRFSCPDPNGKVGFSGVKLEDLTEIKNPKSPAEVIAEENAAEIDLLKWIEKASR